MIRDETLCSFSEWVRPTSEEVVEAMDELNCSLQEWADLIGVKLATISRWRTGKVKIPYAEWATICYLSGLGDIWEKEDSIKKIQNKATRAKKYFILYSQKMKKREEDIFLDGFI